MALLTTFVLVYNVPRFFEYHIEWTLNEDLNSTVPQSVATTIKLNPTYNIVYENVLYCLFVFLGPMALLAVLNFYLIRELWQARRRLKELHLPTGVGGGSSSEAKQEQNITIVMLVIVLVFVMCQTPAYVNQVLYYVLGDEAYVCGQVYFYYYHVSNLFASVNSSVNFVIYCLFRRQFRQRVYAICRRTSATKNRNFLTERSPDQQDVSTCEQVHLNHVVCVKRSA